MMEYREHAPGPILTPWVECFWVRSDADRETGDQRVLPDGCADILFFPAQASATVVGPMSHAIVVPATAAKEPSSPCGSGRAGRAPHCARHCTGRQASPPRLPSLAPSTPRDQRTRSRRVEHLYGIDVATLRGGAAGFAGIELAVFREGTRSHLPLLDRIEAGADKLRELGDQGPGRRRARRTVNDSRRGDQGTHGRGLATAFGE
jgi:hypothetical protein